MCKAMNRSFISVILGGFGAEGGTTAAGAEQKTGEVGHAGRRRVHHGQRRTVIIVPGYGLAVARAQHAVKEMADELTREGRQRQATRSTRWRGACRGT